MLCESFDTLEILQNLIKKNYGFDSEIKQLPGELDLNYYVETPEKNQFILKIAHESQEKNHLEFQSAMMQHIAKKNSTWQFPSVLKALHGEEICEVSIGKDKRLMRLLTWTEGRIFANIKPHAPELLLNLGRLCGDLCAALQDFDHPAAHRFIKWDPAQIAWTKEFVNQLTPEQRQMVEYFYSIYESHVLPLLSHLRKSVNYNDANDHNILVSYDLENPQIRGIIDFGDAVYTHTINELAIAISYAILNKSDPLQAACYIVKGFNQQYALQEVELKALFPLILARLVISLTCSTINLISHLQNTYLQVSHNAVWEVMQKLASISPNFAYYAFRDACGLDPCPLQQTFEKWCMEHSKQMNFPIDMQDDYIWLDLSVGSLDLGNTENVMNPEKLSRCIVETMRDRAASVAIGRYNEARISSDKAVLEGKTIHLGLDFFTTQSMVRAVYQGFVHTVSERTVIIRHEIANHFSFYTRYSGIKSELVPEQEIKKGQSIGSIDILNENQFQISHLHFQILLDDLEAADQFPGMAHINQHSIWKSICPDPWLLFTGMKSPKLQSLSNENILQYRTKHLGKNMSLSYREPIQIVRGHMQYLFDEKGRRYLDTANNVPHVGHEHPRVVKAGQRQMAVLNTNTRYLHEAIVEFTEQLLATLPAQLNVAFLVNSGSEANELALRLAKNKTNQQDIIVSEVGYHGNTNACIEISSYKFDGPGGRGALPHIHVTPLPDIYRGLYRDDASAGEKYAKHIQQAVCNILQQNRKPAAFICESIISCGGQIILPPDYLIKAYQYVRQAGGVCIADEVQTGCGRVGNYFWAFEEHGVIPDIITIGKPIGNGHPLGVVVTTQEIAEAFKNGMEYFNTYGGNPVSCAIGREVLNVVKEENLQQHAQSVGKYLSQHLKNLMNEYPLIGDVRGPGLFIGLEFVQDREMRRTPAPKQASYFVNRMREKGVLMSVDGLHHNVIKIKPPLVFDKGDADYLIERMNEVLKEDFLNFSC